jgi:hypothetical protein
MIRWDIKPLDLIKNALFLSMSLKGHEYPLRKKAVKV